MVFTICLYIEQSPLGNTNSQNWGQLRRCHHLTVGAGGDDRKWLHTATPFARRPGFESFFKAPFSQPIGILKEIPERRLSIGFPLRKWREGKGKKSLKNDSYIYCI